MTDVSSKNFTIKFRAATPGGAWRAAPGARDGRRGDRARRSAYRPAHRGTEKLIEYKTYLQAVPYFDRLDYVAPMCQEHAFALAVEKLLGLEVARAASTSACCSPRSRASSTTSSTSRPSRLDVGAVTPLLWGFEEREKLMEFYERVSGARLHAAYFRPGGVGQDLPVGLADDILLFCEKFPKVIDDIDRLLTNNRIFRQRTVDIARSPRRKRWIGGFSGPCIRGSGVPWDLRRSQPTMSTSRWTSTSRSAKRRLLRPLHGADGGDAPELAHHAAKPAAECRRGRSR